VDRICVDHASGATMCRPARDGLLGQLRPGWHRRDLAAGPPGPVPDAPDRCGRWARAAWSRAGERGGSIDTSMLGEQLTVHVLTARSRSSRGTRR